MPEGKFFAIQSKLNDLVLDIQGSQACSGAQVYTYRFHGGDNQLWWQDSVAGVIRSKQNEDFVLEVQDETLMVNEYQPDEYNQKWRVAGERISHLENDDLVLDIAEQNSDSMARVCSYEYSGQDNQHWTCLYQDAVYFFIHTKNEKHEGKVFDVSGNEDGEGARVILYDQKDASDRHGNENQLFYEDKYGIIHSKMNNCVFDTSDKDDLRMYEYDPDAPLRQYVYSSGKIVLKDEPNRCLQIRDADDFKMFAEFKVEAGDYESHPYQKWRLQYV